MSEEGTGDGIEVRYTKSDEYRTVPASEVSGGVQLGGDFLIDFLVNKTETSGHEQRQVTDTGIGEIVTDNTEFYLERQKQVGVVMNQQQAFSTATWIISDLIGEGVTTDEVQEAIQEQFPETFE